MSVTDSEVEVAIHLDPVAAYDRIATEYGQLSDQRRPYLASIEQLVISEIPHGASSLLDVGAGDGSRAFRIAHAAGIDNIVLLEPSAEMRNKWPAKTVGWALRAEELCEKTGHFDVITCLWNVLGHIFPWGSRLETLRQCARLLAPEGRLFVDLNNRYNAREYGLLLTGMRILRDLVKPATTNGDVVVRWTIDGTKCATSGHVFTHGEFCRMAESAGLSIEKDFWVNYGTGASQRSRFAGNPLFVLRRTRHTF